MTSKGSRSRIRWEGDSAKVIRSWPKAVREDLGLNLHRLDNREPALHDKAMGKSMPGIRELSEEDLSGGYRVLYANHRGRIHVLHCFTKTTQKTEKRDIDLAVQRMAEVERRNEPPEPEPVKSEDKDDA